MKRRLAIIAAALMGMGASPLSAQVFTLLHSFTNSDGAEPYAGLTASGTTLFGTTQYGPLRAGTVFKLNTDGSGFTNLHIFTGTDGSDITAGLLLSGGTLYGAASRGGSGIGQGTLFSLAINGAAFTNHYVFKGTTDGDEPKAGLILSGKTLYGTASSGGKGSMNGTVFAVETNGANFIPLHTFTGVDGQDPEGNLVLGGNVLYGTTYDGGESNLGAIFSVQTDGLNFTVLHSFSNTDGTLPAAGLVLSHGTLYGTASAGGGSGAGTVFSIKTNGAEFTVLHSFIQTAVAATTDGAAPLAGLCLSSNVLYGTTSAGGTNGGGSVFAINTDGSNYVQLRSFGADTAEGIGPVAPVILAGEWLYGTTQGGGAGQSGTVFGLKVRGVTLTTPPIGITNVAVGENALFSAVGESPLSSTARLKYQWRLNGVNIPGATATNLSFHHVQPTNGGSLTITISDGTDALTSVPVGFSVAIQTLASGNDDFANRFRLGNAASGVVRSSNTNATREKGEPEILAGNPGGKSVWFQWQSTNSGTVVFTTRASDFDTIMGVYTGTSVSGLTRVPSCVNDDDYGGYLTSKVTFSFTAGTPYEIVVDGYRGVSGNVVLSWEDAGGGVVHALPSLLEVPPRQTVASNGAAATLVCLASAGTPSWLFNGRPTAVTGPDFIIRAAGAKNVGTYVAHVATQAGVATTEPAYLQINVLGDGTSDSNSIAWIKFLDSATTPYSNPGPASFRKLDGGGDTAGYSVAQTFSTVGAPGEPGEPSIDGQLGGAPVWYSYVTPVSGAMLVDTAGSSFNTLLGVFIGPGDSIATLTNIGAGYTTNRVRNGQPQVFIPDVPAGQTNFIVVDGYNGASGAAQLHINVGNPVVIATPPESQFVLAGSNATFTVAATGSTPLGYLWKFNGAAIAGATRSSLTVSNVQGARTGLYTVVVSNLVSVVSNSATLSLATKPAIVTQPLSQTIALGGTVTLSVTASGEPPPTYQWMFDGGDVGTNGGVLSIPDFQAGNQGTYFVIVSNVAGATASSNALVFLNSLLLVEPSFADRTFQLQLAGAPGGRYVLEASTNLLTWIPLSTNDATNGVLQLTDTNARNFSRRFYRGVTN